MDFLYSLFELQNFIAVVIAALVFLTIMTVVIPLFDQKTLSKKADLVTVEREQMRARYRAQLAEKNKKGSLREKPKGLMLQIVEKLDLRTVFEADTARQLLRSAGYRTEKHLVTYLASRVIAPVGLAILGYFYTGQLQQELPQIMRVLAAVGGAALGYFLPNIILYNMVKKRQQSIQAVWSDALDLMLICVESGMSIEQAMHKVSVEIASSSVPLAEELQYTLAELSYLGDRAQAFNNLAKRVDLPTIKAVVTALVQSERYGTPLGQSLRVLADENRNDRMAELEKKAAALPPKLTVPMILFFLPVIFIVVLGPSVIAVMQNWKG